jgi:cysteine-rich repeat protein
MRARSVVAALALAGCFESSSHTCSDGSICPAVDACDDVHHLCVPRDAFAHCAATADGTHCTYDDGTSGTCFDNVCLPAQCGNGRVDFDEACDTALPGTCAVDCSSTLACGNGIVDPAEECDDGNATDHDGCTTACTAETPHWVRHPSSVGVAYAPATFDGAHPLVYGGLMTASLAPSRDTWTWEGTWRPLSTFLKPPARTSAGFAWDAARGQAILFGGDPQVDDTMWELAGTTWTNVAVPAATELRLFPAMTFDGARNAVIAFGGQDQSMGVGDEYGDTIAWDGTSWAAVTGPQPPKLYAAGLAYDKHRDVAVLFGGYGGVPGAASNAVWELDGTGWHAASTSPSARLYLAMAYDDASQRVIVFGGATLPRGFSSSLALDETWAWDGTTWTNLTTATKPPKRAGAALVPDGNGRLLLVGGDPMPSVVSGDAPLADTWIFDNGVWSQVVTPPARSSAALAYDAVGHRAIMQGGLVGPSPGTTVNDTWELTPRGWRKLALATNPGLLTYAGMAFDDVRGEYVLFGGLESGAGDSNQTWTFDGSAWTQQTTPPAIAARLGPSLAFDPVSQRVIMFGGTGSDPDTYAWDGSTWITVATSGPPPRVSGAMAGDPLHRQVVLFGGYQLGDTWIWDGTQWTQGPPGPPADKSVSLVWNPARQRLVLYGSPSATTWEWDGQAWARLQIPEDGPVADASPNAMPSLDGSGILVMDGLFESPTPDDIWELRWEPVR